MDSEEKVNLLEAKDMENDKITKIHNSDTDFVIVKQNGNSLVNNGSAKVEEETQPNGHIENGTIAPSTERRSDEPSELSFEKGKISILFI